MPTVRRGTPGASASASVKMSVVGSLGMKISPPRMRSSPRRMSRMAPSMSIQNRVMRSSVMVRWPLSDCSRKSGMTLPALPITLP